MLLKLIFLLCLPVVLLSQEKKSKLFFKKLGLKDGLSSYNIRKILHDKYDFTWIATQDGLNHYDGNTIEVFNKNNNDSKHRLLGNDITDIVEDTARNILWASTSYGGLNGINISTKNIEYTNSLMENSTQLQNQWIRCIDICLGNIWIGSNDGINIYNPNTRKIVKTPIIPFRKTKEIKNFNIDLIFVDQYSRVWVFFSNLGLVIYSGNNYEILCKYDLTDFKLPYIKDYRIFNGLVKLSNNELLVATHNGFVNLSYSNEPKIQISDKNILNFDFKNENISAIVKDKENNIWFSTTDKLFKSNKNGSQTTEIISVENAGEKINLNSIFTIFFDKNNYVWLGTVKELLYSKNKPISFSPYYQSNDYKTRIDHSYFIYPKTDSFIYVCASDGLYSIDLATDKFQKIDSLKSYFFFYEFQKIFFVTNEKGFYIYSPITKKIIVPWLAYKELIALKGELINSIIPIGDSALLLGSETGNGIYLWNFKKHGIANYNSATNMEFAGSDIVNIMYKDGKNNIWILGDNQIIICNPAGPTFKRLLWKDAAGKPLNIYFDINETKNDYWIAAYGTGIIQVDKNKLNIKKILSVDNGLQNTGVYKIIKANDSLSYISSNNGIYLLNTDNLKCKSYYESDGLNSSAFEGWCGAQKNEFIYMGGDKGLTVINTKEHQNINTVPPNVFITRTRIESDSKIVDTSNLFLNRINVSSGYNQVSVFFSAINYSNPQRTIFFYRITELHTDWLSINTQNFINLIGLSPGTYHLQVKAANEDGISSEAKELVLEFLPKWYQTWWFKLLVLVITASIIYAFYRYRIRQIKKQHEIRRNIATDLHDDLGSTLNSVKVFANLAISGVKQEESLQQVKDNLTEATMSLRDMIWVLDDSLDTVDELITRLKQFAIPVAGASNIEAIIKSDSEVNSRQLTKEEKRNLFLICKESINNSIKYSEASQIIVAVTASGKKIKIEIADDGKGFDATQVKKGYGLKNMQYRAGQIKYKVDLQSILNTGTRINIEPF